MEALGSSLRLLYEYTTEEEWAEHPPPPVADAPSPFAVPEVRDDGATRFIAKADVEQYLRGQHAKAATDHERGEVRRLVERLHSEGSIDADAFARLMREL